MYTIIILERVMVFFKENNINSHILDDKVSILKYTPFIFQQIGKNKNTRSFIVNNLKFGYYVYKNSKLVVITDCVYLKSNVKLKVR